MTRFLLRHTAYALALFSSVALLMEAFMPGSVLPYLDPIPFAIATVIALGASALYPVRESRPVAKTVVLTVLGILACGIVSLTFIAPGMRSVIAIGLISVSVIVAAVMTGLSSR
ncbi:MAG: hypothetical protein WC477_01015 [Patescibacteria group bacterium]